MIFVRFRYPSEVEGQGWYIRFLASERLKANWFEVWERYRIRKKNAGGDPDPEVWARVKKYLFALFNHKCGYCEALVDHVYHGDVDHFRPKSLFPELAYEITNYVPACKLCNSGGKGAKFEVVGEKPLLLDPCETPPPTEQHLFFHARAQRLFSAGMVEGLTSQGKATIRICDLNRERLTDVRALEQTQAIRDFFFEVARLGAAAREEEIMTAKQACSRPEAQFAAARRDAIASFSRMFAAAA
jgi:hypothetical protein